MSEKPDALRLAEALETPGKLFACYEVAAELRRLHGIEFALRDCEKTLEGMAKQYMDAADQRDELLEALRRFANTDLTVPIVRDTFGFDVLRARAAIAKAEGQA